MTEVLFGQAYYLRFDPKLWASMQPYPPLGTLLAASFLRTRGYDVGVFDAMLARSEAEWGESLDAHAPRFAVLFEDNFNYLSKMCLLRMREAAFSMIRMAKARNTIVIVCGADPTDHAEQYLREGADYVLVGEGEQTLAELLDQLTGRRARALSSIAGLAFPSQGDDPGSTVAIGPRRNVIKQLDELPLPAWDLIDMERYRRIWYERHGYYSINMVTTRGCPYHCNWCAKPIWGQRYNSRSAQSVVEEMSILKTRYRPDHIWFADDIFGLKPGWLERFGELTEQRNIRLPYKCLSRADLLLRGNEVSALARSGCDVVWMGAESGSQKILDAMDKGTRVDQIYEASKRLHEAGVRVGFFLQFGYPGEDIDDIEKTFQMVRDCAPDEIGISVSYPLPGTKFYSSVETQLGKKKNWVDSGDLDMMYEGPFATGFYRKLHTILHKEFRARQSWQELRHEGAHIDRVHARKAAGMLLRAATLPFERRGLRRRAEGPHRGIGPLRGLMSHDEAATPTPQD